MSSSLLWMDSSKQAAEHWYLRYCNAAVSYQALTLIFPQLWVSIAFGCILRLCRSEWAYHVVSSILGLALMYFYDVSLLASLIFLSGASYGMLAYFRTFNKYVTTRVPTDYLYGIVCCGIVTFFEINGKLGFFEWAPHRIMWIMAMLRIFSLSTKVSKSNPLPEYVEYVGYVFCPALVLNGPFITFDEYCELYGIRSTNKWNCRRFWRIVICTVRTVVCFLIGDCMAAKFVPVGTGLWYEAYRKALTFRINHYGRNYAAGAQLVAAGFNNHPEEKKGKWDYIICKPRSVEFPRCLSTALVALDLRIFIFVNDYLPNIFYNHLFALIANIYFFTALMHLENVDPIIFCISIFVFTFTVYQFRLTVARFFSVCVLTEKCRDKEHCDVHSYADNTMFCTVINFIFAILAVIMLTYLMVLLDDVGFLESRSVYATGSEKWGALSFLGHHIIFGFSLLMAILEDP